LQREDGIPDGTGEHMFERVAKAALRGDNDGDGDSILTGLSGVVIVVLVVLGIWYFARRRG
jgi:hypothetical protein